MKTKQSKPALSPASHTPGKWEYYADQTNGVVVTCGEKTICQTNETEVDEGNISIEEMEANARLIAAAPEMITALKDAQATLLRWKEYDSEAWDKRDEETLNNIELSIKKATGQQAG